MPKKKAERCQLASALVLPRPARAKRRPPGPSVAALETTPAVMAQFDACLCKQAERHLGRPLGNTSELYGADLITAVAREGAPCRSGQEGRGDAKKEDR